MWFCLLCFCSLKCVCFLVRIIRLTATLFRPRTDIRCFALARTGVSAMEGTPVEIYKEESRCVSALLEDCQVNASSSWTSGYTESRNVTHDEGWEQESMSPIIPIITAVYSVVFVVGLLGNCLVMYVIIRSGYFDIFCVIYRCPLTLVLKFKSI